MLPTYQGGGGGGRRRGALLNHGNIRRLLRGNPKFVTFGLPALALVSVLATSFFAQRVAEPRGLEPQRDPVAQQLHSRSHQSEELEDWGSPAAAAVEPGGGPPVEAAPAAKGATGAALETLQPPPAAVPPAAQPAGPAAAAAPAEGGAVDTSTLAEEHPWLTGEAEQATQGLREEATAVGHTIVEKVGEPLSQEATAVAQEEKAWVQSTEKALASDTELIEQKAESVLEEAGAEAAKVEAEAAKVVAPLENEVETVLQEAEREAGAVESGVSGAVRTGAAELRQVGGAVKAVGSGVEEAVEAEVIVVVGTVEEMVFSWTFFGVFLLALWRVSRKERQWWREQWRTEVTPEPKPPAYPREKLLLSPRGHGEGGGQQRSPALFAGDVADVLEGADREALELGRLLLQERAAASRMQQAARQSAQSAFDSSW